MSCTNIIQIDNIVNQITIEYKFIEGEVLEVEDVQDNSWTISHSLKTNTWTSWHSYMPNMYFNTSNKFFSWIQGNNNIWKHNVPHHYQTFYGVYYPHIIEYVSLSTPLLTRLWNHLRLITEAKKFSAVYEDYVEDRFTTFNKAVFYNSRQCSGLMNLLVKDTDFDPQDYFQNQTENVGNVAIIDRTEKDWTLNDLRDIRVDYSLPIWDNTLTARQNQYYIDKVLNTLSLDVNKDWTQLESFRDKYLVIRLIFDKFADVNLITNYSVENEQQSFN